MPVKVAWDTELYEARHGFVWQFGEGVIDLLDPKPGERILDLGCGPGQLTQKIADRGANVLGLDSSPEMIGQARQNYPTLTFALQDAVSMDFDREFDAIFSNAALHWILDAQGAARAMARALKKNGRLAAELGGKGNIQQIVSAIEATIARFSGDSAPAPRTYFPSVGEYASVLEAYGLEVRFAHLFDRPTLLEGEQGMEAWIRQFKWYYFEGLPASQRAEALRDVVEELRPVLHRDGCWYADYRRLRIFAVKN
jgi:trans-aconitate 2-methyltransferase